jgi:hypothetical protein
MVARRVGALVVIDDSTLIANAALLIGAGQCRSRNAESLTFLLDGDRG